MFLYVRVILRILTYICIQSMQFSSEIGFYDAKSDFRCSLENIFGKVVTLLKWTNTNLIWILNSILLLKSLGGGGGGGVRGGVDGKV